MRVAVAVLGVEADQLAAARRPGRGSGLAAARPVDDQRLGDDVVDRHPRVQRRVRVLEDDLQVAAQRPHRRAAELGQLPAVVLHRADGGRLQVEDRPAGGRLAAAGLADQARASRPGTGSKSMPSTAVHVPTVRRSRPLPWIGKCFTRSGPRAPAGCRCPARGLVRGQVRGGHACSSGSRRRPPRRPAGRGPCRAGAAASPSSADAVGCGRGRPVERRPRRMRSTGRRSRRRTGTSAASAADELGWLQRDVGGVGGEDVLGGHAGLDDLLDPDAGGRVVAAVAPTQVRLGDVALGVGSGQRGRERAARRQVDQRRRRAHDRGQPGLLGRRRRAASSRAARACTASAAR